MKTEAEIRRAARLLSRYCAENGGAVTGRIEGASCNLDWVIGKAKFPEFENLLNTLELHYATLATEKAAKN